MGEYATVGGRSVKIGTCENMYYLRADQRHQVQPESGSLDPRSDDALKVIRFRFPWPDEDQVGVGRFEEYDRQLGVSFEWSKPPEYEHGSVQFVASVGMNFCIPCPLGPDARKDIVVHKNGWRGDVLLSQTAWRDGEWRVVCRCGACGYPFNLPLWMAEELAVAIRKHADYPEHMARMSNRTDAAVAWHHAVADRVLAGYKGAEVSA